MDNYKIVEAKVISFCGVISNSVIKIMFININLCQYMIKY